MEKTVILSDGEECSVTVLGLFGLDGIGPQAPDDFRYEVDTVTGVSVEATYPLDRITAPPAKPDIRVELLVEGTQEWLDYREWETYRAALMRRAEQREAQQRWLLNAARHIAKTCVSDEDRQRLVTDKDWDTVYAAALVPRLSIEDLETALQDTYGVTFDDAPLLDALLSGGGDGHTKLDVLRWWEVRTLDGLGIWKHEDMDEWLQLPVKDRAARVAGFNLGEWSKALEVERSIKDAKRKGKS